jgi:GT2 family glycosyltransferase
VSDRKRSSLVSRARRTLGLRTRLRGAVRAAGSAIGLDRYIEERGSRLENVKRLTRLLDASVLFDADWYARISGHRRTRGAAVRHYVAEGRGEGLTPHPLFDPAFFAAQHAAVIGLQDPLGIYLSEPTSRSASPHPLFDAPGYLARTPGSSEHPLGPLGHYLEVGARSGLRPNDWYEPRPHDEPSGLADWIRARAAEWAVRQREAATWEAGLRGAVATSARDRLAAAASRVTDEDRVPVSVIISSHDDANRAATAVRSVVEAARSSGTEVQIVVVSNGSGLTDSVVLDSLPLRFPGVRVLANPVDHGFALGSNMALPEVDGRIVVFLHNDTEVGSGWLEPLIDALGDPNVLGAQSLLLHPGGSIQSAGIAFPSCGGIPHLLLDGFPAGDAQGIAAARFSALTGAAMAVRFSDLVAVSGFDPVFRDGLADVDFGLRLKALKGGSFSVQPTSVVVHYESSATEHSAEPLTDRRLLLDRWGNRMPGDDGELWSEAGYEVVGHQVGEHASDDHRLTPPEPVLKRRPRISTSGGPPALRWAIKIAAPNDATASHWGDTYFARQLAAAFRTLGQEVIIDHRPEFERRSGRFDDVVLVLRGLAPYRPQYGQISLCWLISHPKMLGREGAASYDRLFAASGPWAERMSREWEIRIDPLLQATDPSLFNPDRAGPDTGHPVLFVGSSRRKVRPIVRDAVEAGLPLAIFGREWDGLVPLSHVEAEYLANDAVGAAYRAAGVVLNDHWEDMRIDGFLSNRLFDAAASGARVITDDVTGLGDIFGRSVQVARDKDELVALASAPDLDAIFGGDDERRAVAARLHAEHSFAARARRLLDAALELRSDLSDATRAEARALAGVER